MKLTHFLSKSGFGIEVIFKITLALILLFNGLHNYAQSLSASITVQHGAGCDNQSGILSVSASGGTGIYTYAWNNNATSSTLSNLGAGNYVVEVFDGNDTINVSYTLNPFGVQNIAITNSCSGNPGNAEITGFNAQSPVMIRWYNSSGTPIGSQPWINNLQAGDYSYSLTDAEGCIDSASLTIVASNPVLQMFAADSILCYNESSEIWFTPGFILYDGMFPVYNTSIDTLTYVNSNSGNYIPNTGMDQYGCWASVTNNPITYTQPEPWPMLTIYNYGDTLSLDWGINDNPDPINHYNWYLDGVLIASYAYSYVPVQTSGTYSVQEVNQYGCYNTGVINVTVAGTTEETQLTLQVLENPVCQDQDWVLSYSGENVTTVSLYNAVGQQLQQLTLHKGYNYIGNQLTSGMYFLHFENQSLQLVKN